MYSIFLSVLLEKKDAKEVIISYSVQEREENEDKPQL